MFGTHVAEPILASVHVRARQQAGHMNASDPINLSKNSCKEGAVHIWHLDEAVVSIRGKKHWLWRAVDQDDFVLEVLVQSRRNAKAAKRLMRKLLKSQGRAPRVMITDKLRSYDAAKRSRCCCARHHLGFFGSCGPFRFRFHIISSSLRQLFCP